jgi:hypothetical protein
VDSIRFQPTQGWAIDLPNIQAAIIAVRLAQLQIRDSFGCDAAPKPASSKNNGMRIRASIE